MKKLFSLLVWCTREKSPGFTINRIEFVKFQRSSVVDNRIVVLLLFLFGFSVLSSWGKLYTRHIHLHHLCDHWDCFIDRNQAVIPLSINVEIFVYPIEIGMEILAVDEAVLFHRFCILINFFVVYGARYPFSQLVLVLSRAFFALMLWTRENLTLTRKLFRVIQTFREGNFGPLIHKNMQTHIHVEKESQEQLVGKEVRCHPTERVSLNQIISLGVCKDRKCSVDGSQVK